MASVLKQQKAKMFSIRETDVNFKTYECNSPDIKDFNAQGEPGNAHKLCWIW